MHFEKTSVSPSSNNGVTPASPPKISLQPVSNSTNTVTATTVGLLPPTTSTTVVTNSTSGNSFSAVTLPVVTNNVVDHPDDEEDEGYIKSTVSALVNLNNRETTLASVSLEVA